MKKENGFIKTGFKELDEALNGGFKRGDLVLLASIPGMGKTSFALNIIDNCLNNDKFKCAFFSLDMTKDMIIQRILSTRSGVKLEYVLAVNPKESDWKEFYKQADGYKKDNNIFIEDNCMISIDEIISRCKEVKDKYGLDLVVIDYFQLIATSKNVTSTNRCEEVGNITSKLKIMAKDLDISIVLLSQLLRQCREDKKPILQDLQDVYLLDEYLDLVLFLYNPDVYSKGNNKGVVELNIAKTTHGESKVIKYKFLKDCLKFEGINK